MDKFLCFRFDVDTHVCLRDGVPNLLEMMTRYGVKCTFFVSMGRAFDRRQVVRERFRARKTSTKYNFSMISKLGRANTVEALLINPKIGASYSKILENAIASGHELGLHGGRNHATWNRHAVGWDTELLEDEIIFGLDNFKGLGLPTPASFASPCWKSPKHLPGILQRNGISMLSDSHSDDMPFKKDGLHHYPVNITSPRANIGFIENHRALGRSDAEILADFRRQLDLPGNFKMVFDHPIYAGIQELSIIAAMAEIALEKGFRLETLRNIDRLITI